MSSKITRRKFLKVSGVTGAVLMASSAKPVLSQEKVIKWKGQSCFSSTTTPYGPFGPKLCGVFGGCYRWTQWLTEATGGQLQIDWAEPGAIVPNAEVDTAVSKNVVQIAHAFSPYYAGRVPEADVESGGVFLWEDNAQFLQCLLEYGFGKAVQKVYDKYNIKWIPFSCDPINGLGTTFPAPNAQSVRGKKIRAVGMWAELIAMLGGNPVPIPFGEMYMAMKLGTVDGWVAGAAALEDNKLKEVTKGFVYSPNLSIGILNLLINKDALNALPPNIRAILERDAPYVTYSYSSNWHNQCNWVLKDSAQKYGLKLYAWPQEDADRLVKQSFEVIYPKIARKSKGCEELLEIVKKQMRDYGRI